MQQHLGIVAWLKREHAKEDQENCEVGDWSIFRLKDGAMALDCCPKTWTCPPCVCRPGPRVFLLSRFGELGNVCPPSVLRPFAASDAASDSSFSFREDPPMIGTRTPFRISFAGGGSDLRSFYSKQPGCVLSTSINKYMYILVHPFFDDRIQIKYSRTELVNSIAHIEHPIVRVALGQFGVEGVDVNSIADIPAGTGLGSSCSFTVGLLHALYTYTGQPATKELLARKACEIEIEILKDPIGKQDIYAAAYGGLNLITFYPDETVQVEPVLIPFGRRAGSRRTC